MVSFSKYSVSLFLFFISINLFAQIPNPGFEDWTSQGFPSYLNPDDWSTLNSNTALIGVYTVTRASGADAHSGSYAIRLQTHYISFAARTAPGIAVTANINTTTEEFEGGFPYTQRPDKLRGWFKYSPQSGDNCNIEVFLFKRVGGNQITVAEGDFTTTATVGSYTQFEIDLTYNTADIPDTARIFLSSSNPDTPQQNSVLFVDDLEFVFCNNLAVSVSSTDVTMVGGSDAAATANVTGGTAPFIYTWANGSTTNPALNLPAGIVCVTVTDAAGCDVSACDTITEPSCSSFTLNLVKNDVTTPGGNDGNATALPTGGIPPYTYIWSNSATTATVSNLASAQYCVTVTDSVGCVLSACTFISNPSCGTFAVNLTAVGVTYVGSDNGSITANPADGIPPYTYSWSNGDSLQTVNGLAPGNYCVTVTDSINCQDIICIDITEPDCSNFSVAVSGTDLTTVGGDDGTATAAAANGIAPYVYEWANGESTSAIDSLGAGFFCVTVTDNVGCTASACLTISDPDCSGFRVSLTTLDASIPTSNDGSITAEAFGGVAPYSYSWSNGVSDSANTGLNAGTYCATITDAVGCTLFECDTVGVETVGISAVFSKMGTVYPNPAQSFISVEVENGGAHIFKMYDLNGKLVLENLLNDKISKVALRAFPSGNYFYSIQEKATGKVSFGKLLVE